jgi:hypothetical protein
MPVDVTEADILAGVLDANQGDLPPEVARSLLRWKFSRTATSRINRLSRANQRGVATAAEREELERYLRVGSLLNLVQAKARLSLSANEAD